MNSRLCLNVDDEKSGKMWEKKISNSEYVVLDDLAHYKRYFTRIFRLSNHSNTVEVALIQVYNPDLNIILCLFLFFNLPLIH